MWNLHRSPNILTKKSTTPLHFPVLQRKSGDLGVCKETGGSTFHNVNYLFGPRFSYRSYGKITPFAQALFGGQHAAGSNLAFDSFAMTLGGGADYRYNEHISFQGQAEYLYTHFAGTRQNNARIEVGLFTGGERGKAQFSRQRITAARLRPKAGGTSSRLCLKWRTKLRPATGPINGAGLLDKSTV